MFSDSRAPSTLVARPPAPIAAMFSLLVGRLIPERLQRRHAAETAARNDAREQRAEKEVSPRDAVGHRDSFFHVDRTWAFGAHSTFVDDARLREWPRNRHRRDQLRIRQAQGRRLSETHVLAMSVITTTRCFTANMDARRGRVVPERPGAREQRQHLTARGAPPPLALARRLRAALGPQARQPLSAAIRRVVVPHVKGWFDAVASCGRSWHPAGRSLQTRSRGAMERNAPAATDPMNEPASDASNPTRIPASRYLAAFAIAHPLGRCGSMELGAKESGRTVSDGT